MTVVERGEALEAVRALFLEYAGTLGFSLCFQGFDKELETLPGDYAPPRGLLLLARQDGQDAGCIGLRPFDETRAEIKRLYIRPPFRGAGLGRTLAAAAIAHARSAGYRGILLDTLPAMREARALYSSLGFADCPAYYDNSCVGSDCYELKL